MKFSSYIGFSMLCLLPSLCSQAADKIELIAGLSKPPFVIEHEPEKSGILLETSLLALKVS